MCIVFFTNNFSAIIVYVFQIFHKVNVTIVFIHATYNYRKLCHVEITYVFDTCKIKKKINNNLL